MLNHRSAYICLEGTTNLLHREREKTEERKGKRVNTERERERESVLKMVALFFYFECSLFA